jgi:carbon storage regulator
MLILSRREGEAFFIDENIKIIVTDISTSSVRIGIEAPPEKIILREELMNKPRDLLRDRPCHSPSIPTGCGEESTL